MKSVTQKMANDCINAYTAAGKKLTSTLTTGVGFDASQLSNWLQKVAPFAKEIQVSFGIYTAEHAPTPKDLGRVTVFFVACDANGNTAKDGSGKAIPPVNTGIPYP